jgi:GlpG protein
MLIGFLTGLRPAHDDPRIDLLWFSNDGTLKPILKGEVWRLITPIFIHMDWMHLLFNMLGLQQFGMQIEYRKGTPKYLGMVLVIAVLSNFAQFLATGQYFGGMSGVVYGLFGYLWVKSRLEPDSGFSMAQQTVTVMIGWHILCMMGWVGQIANWAHGIGLVTGVAFGMSASLLKPFRRTD